MARTDSPRRKARPAQGARLRQLRLAAGLSQTELARLIGVPQPNIAFWEASEKPPRSEVLPSMAKALGVSLDALLVAAPGAAAGRRPAGKVRRVFEDVAKLPRRQQEKIAEVVAALVTQYEQSRQN